MMAKTKFLPPLKIKTKDRILLVWMLLFILACSPFIAISAPIMFVLRRFINKHRYFERLLAQGMIYERLE